MSIYMYDLLNQKFDIEEEDIVEALQSNTECRFINF
jgi:hypothetical protein